jgi:hypothetical protein
MVDIEAYPYLCFVRFDLASREFDREFNIHYDEHIQELADKPGYSTAWRTREMRGSFNAGVMEQEYQQIYAIVEPGVFKSFPQNPPPPVMEHEPFRRDIRNWGRVFYRVLRLREKDDRAGRCWARCDIDFSGGTRDEERLRSQSAQHLERVLELPGVHRAWELQHAPHPAQIGPDPPGKYMNLYELDAPENLFDPSLGEERLPLQAGQQSVGRHFAWLLRKAEPRQ